MKSITYKIASWIGIIFALSWCAHSVHGQRLAAQKCQEYRKQGRYFPVALSWHLNEIVRTRSDEITPTYNCSNDVQLIVGGEEAKSGEFPHHALLGYANGGNVWVYDFLCGGTLISDQHVLTAAHCFSFAIPEVVRLGEHDTGITSYEEYDEDIESYRKHPDYKNKWLYNDIALVKLKYPIIFTPRVRPACLWTSENRTTTKFIVTGFSQYVPYFDPSATVLMKVQLDEFPAGDCARDFNGSSRLPTGMHDGQPCVGSISSGRDICRGNSGGPLQVLTNSATCSYAVVGITSAGGPCGIGQSKSIYTKVSRYIGWIEDTVWGDNAL